MNNVINFNDEKMARINLEERAEMYKTDVMCWINELIESPSDLYIVNTSLRGEGEEIPEDSVEFIDSNREDYAEFLWTRFVDNDKTIFNASFSQTENWMSLLYSYTGENIIIEKVS